MNDKEKKEDDAMDNIINFKIFEDLDDDKKRIDRMTAALKYYQHFSLNSKHRKNNCAGPVGESKQEKVVVFILLIIMFKKKSKFLIRYL